jgi:hypothetical protein
MLKDERDATLGRVLDQSEAKVLVEKLKQFKGKKFWIIIETNDYDNNSEQMRFGIQLGLIFEAAGWTKEPHLGIPPEPVPGREAQPARHLPMYLPLSSRGIRLAHSTDDSTRMMAEQVRTSLKQGNSPIRTRPVSNMIADALIVTVGQR